MAMNPWPSSPHRRHAAVPDVVLGCQLAKIVDKHSRGNLRLDFRHVEFLTSADIGRLVRLWKKLKDDGRRLAFHNVKPLVYQVFQVIRVNKLMEIRDKCPKSGKGEFGIDKPRR